MALSDQAALGTDAAFKAKVKVLLIAKALTVASADVRATSQPNEQELRLAAAVLRDPDVWATIGAAAAASLMTGAIATWPAAALTLASTDAELRAAVLSGTRSVWMSLGGAV